MLVLQCQCNGDRRSYVSVSKGLPTKQGLEPNTAELLCNRYSGKIKTMRLKLQRRFSDRCIFSKLFLIETIRLSSNSFSKVSSCLQGSCLRLCCRLASSLQDLIEIDVVGQATNVIATSSYRDASNEDNKSAGLVESAFRWFPRCCCHSDHTFLARYLCLMTKVGATISSPICRSFVCHDRVLFVRSYVYSICM